MLSNLNSNLALTLGCLNPDLNNSALKPGGGGGGYFRNFWAGMCRWDP